MEALTERAMSKLLLIHARFLVFLAGLFPSLMMQAQAVTSDFSSMVAAGKETIIYTAFRAVGSRHSAFPGPIFPLRRRYSQLLLDDLYVKFLGVQGARFGLASQGYAFFQRFAFSPPPSCPALTCLATGEPAETVSFRHSEDGAEFRRAAMATKSR